MKKAFLLLLLVTACSKNNNEIQQKLVDAYNNLDEKGYILRLNELDEQFPENFYINIDLGYYYLLNSDYYNANTRFSNAEKNRIKKDREWNYKLYGGIADLRYVQGNWYSVIEAGEKALINNPDDPSVIKLTMAKAFSSVKDYETGYRFYKEVYAEHPGFLKYNDWDSLSELSILQKDKDFTYSLWMDYWKRHGYDPGLGIRISILSGNLGNQKESLLTSFIDLDFQKSLGLIQKKDLDFFLQEVEQFDVDEKLKEGLSHYINSSWPDAIDAFAYREGEPIVLTFLRLSSKIENNDINQKDIDDYLNLEPYFYNHPYFYHRLLKSGKKISMYSELEIIEKAIVYSSKNFSYQYRAALGKSIGLEDNQITHLLVPMEIENHSMEYKKNGDLEKLRPLIHFLNIPSVYSTNDAISELSILSRDPVVRNFLALIEKDSIGILEARLESILN